MTDETKPGETPDPVDERTQEYPAFVYEPAAPAPDEADAPTGAEPDDDWPVRAPARGIRLALPTAGLVGVLLLAGGFWGGAALEKSHASSSGARGASGIAARFRNALTGTTTTGTTTTGTGGLGFGGGSFGGGAAGTVGTISVVDGSTLYVLTSAGALLKVTLGPSATVSRNAKAQADGLRPGDTVIVQGATAANGDVTATSVAATAPGVTSTGFGRGGGFGGGAAAGTGATTTTGG